MRPNKLSLTAFGPYHQTEVIDFDALAPHDLFVVSGNTGAGKTSIFDGLSFALFGGASGEDRKEALSLRSDFANDDLPSSVELFFTIQDRKFRVMRQLAYQKTGNKSITPAKAELYELITQDGELIEVSAVDRQMISDVDEKMQSLIGLSKEQFNQLIMLPQGEYQRFLTSSTSDKEAILRTVFNTEKYRALSDTLKASRDQAQKAIDSLSGNIQSTMESLFRQLPTRESLLFTYKNEAGKVSLNPHQAQEALKVEAEFYSLEKKCLTEVVQKRYAEYQKSQAALIHGKSLNEQFTKLADVSQRYQLHLSHKETMDQLQQTIILAEKAQPIEKHHDAVMRLRTEAQQKQLLLKNAELTLKNSQLLLTNAKVQLQLETEKEPEREALIRAILRLEANEPKVLQLAERQKETQKLAAQLEAQNTQIQKTETIIQKLIKEQLQLKAKNTALSVQSDQRIPLIQLSTKVQDLAKSRQLMVAEQHNIATITLAKKNAEADLKIHKNAFDQHYQAWLNAQTDKIASTLQSGEPCPVCGSKEHPKLAKTENASLAYSPQLAISFEESQPQSLKVDFARLETLLTEAQSTLIQTEALISNLVSQAKTAHQNLQQETERFQMLWADLQLFYASDEAAILADLQIPQLPLEVDNLPKNSTGNALSELLNTIKDAEQKTSNAGKLLIDIRNALETVDKSITEYQASLNTFKDSHRDIEAKLSIEQQTRALLAAEISESLQDITHFQKALAEKRTQLQRLKSDFTNAEKAYQQAEKEMISLTSTVSHETKAFDLLITQGKEARKTLDQALIQAGFTSRDNDLNTTNDFKDQDEIKSDEAAFIAAKRAPDSLKEMRLELQHYQEQLQILTTQKADLKALLKDKALADITALEETTLSLEAQYETEKRMSFEVEALLKTIENSSNALSSLQKNYNSSAIKLSRIIEIHNLVRGENSQKISFERYILIEYFERVIEAANLRLQKMTSGQFEFIRSDELASRGKQSGLDLNIYDAYTGEARDVKSLSGGEKFKASLSLSLGMADVIQAHQGGISINTLFIDEGFGSLDEESLLQAIDVLIDLQKSGRMIGVISHVEELKQTLPARIEVTKTPGGFSKTKIVVQ